jgi:hypothetical protein
MLVVGPTNRVGPLDDRRFRIFQAATKPAKPGQRSARCPALQIFHLAIRVSLHPIFTEV